MDRLGKYVNMRKNSLVTIYSIYIVCVINNETFSTPDLDWLQLKYSDILKKIFHTLLKSSLQIKDNMKLQH
jgi:hypothetical protein